MLLPCIELLCNILIADTSPREIGSWKPIRFLQSTGEEKALLLTVSILSF